MSVCQFHGSVSIYVCFCECSVYFNGVLVCDNNSVVCVCVCVCVWCIVGVMGRVHGVWKVHCAMDWVPSKVLPPKALTWF